MNKQSKTLTALVIVGLLGALAVGATSHWFSDFSSYTSVGDAVKNWVNGSGSSSSSSQSGSSSSSPLMAIRVQEMSTGTDGSGHVTKTFSYSVSPTNADDTIVYSIAWSTEDATHTSSNLSSYVTAALDTVAETCTLTCLQAFDSQITLTIKSYQTPSAAGTVQIEYLRKVLSITSAGTLKVPCDAADNSDLMATCSWTENSLSFTKQGGGSFGSLLQIVYSSSIFTVDELGSPVISDFVSSNFVLGYGNSIGPVGSHSYDGSFNAVGGGFQAEIAGLPGWTGVGSVVAETNSKIAANSSSLRSLFKSQTYDQSPKKYLVWASDFSFRVSWGSTVVDLVVPVRFALSPDQVNFNIPASSVTVETGTVRF